MKRRWRRLSSEYDESRTCITAIPRFNHCACVSSVSFVLQAAWTLYDMYDVEPSFLYTLYSRFGIKCICIIL